VATEAATFSAVGYPCEVTYYPNAIIPPGTILIAPSNGEFGRVTATFYSQPYCAGSFVRLATLFSEGSTILNYTVEDIYQPYGEAALMNAHAALRRATDEGARASISGVTYTGGIIFPGAPPSSQLHTFAIRPN
jgi:hypothetical protein